MNILLGMEHSNTIAGALRAKGHFVISCDLLPNDVTQEWHYQGDIYDVLYLGFDMIIMHPECTAMSLSGNRHYAKGKPFHHKRVKALEFTEKLWRDCVGVCDKVVFEQPHSVLCSSKVLPSPQYIQPWQFGHPETKKTALFLHGVPALKETNNVYEYMMTLTPAERHKIWYASPGVDRWKKRSKTFQGIADAIAHQWG